MSELTLGEAADKLNEALDLVSDLFARCFHSPAHVTLPSGGELSFRKLGKDFVLVFGDVPLTRAPLGRRVEVVAHLSQLWRACTHAEEEQRQAVGLATVQALGFVRTMRVYAPGEQA